MNYCSEYFIDHKRFICIDLFVFFSLYNIYCIINDENNNYIAKGKVIVYFFQMTNKIKTIIV